MEMAMAMAMESPSVSVSVLDFQKLILKMKTPWQSNQLKPLYKPPKH
jgi:hypothetical protein